VDYHFQDTDYELTEAHAEESNAHDGDQEHGADEEHDAHEGPTIFTNEAQEFGAVFDFSNEALTQKVAVGFVSEDTAIVGDEVFMNPVNTDEVTLGYYANRRAGEFIIDFGARNNWVERNGSVSAEEEHAHGEEENEDEDHAEDAELQYFNSEESITSYGLQIARPFNDQFTATLNLSRVEKAPAAVELFMNGAHLAIGRFEVGDPNLESERAQSVELTFDYSSEAFFGSLTVYSNNIDNYIYLQDETVEEHEEHGDEHGGLILANYVQRDAEFNGYEFEIGKVFPLAGGDLTFSYGLDAVSADFSDNTNVPRINPDRSIYQAAYARGSFDMKVIFKDVESQTDTASYEEFTKGYSMLNVRASNTFTLSDGLALNVSLFGSNLLNEIARNHSSFVKDDVPLPGRSYGLKFYAAF
jgi:iron complex outermembrane receptor protein